MPAGRPKKKIDYETVEKLASIMCTQEEISTHLDISVRTLQRDAEFCRIYKKGLDRGKMSLRRTQFKMAEASAAMAIWLGKQYLGQRDKFENEITSEALDNTIKQIQSIADLVNKPTPERNLNDYIGDSDDTVCGTDKETD